MAVGLAISEAKTEIMCLRTKGLPESSAIFSVEATGQVYNQMKEFVYLESNVNHDTNLSIGVNRHIRSALYSFKSTPLKCTTERVLELKIRTLRAEVFEKTFYDCVTWNQHVNHYDTLRRVHHSFLIDCIGW